MFYCCHYSSSKFSPFYPLPPGGRSLRKGISSPNVLSHSPKLAPRVPSDAIPSSAKTGRTALEAVNERQRDPAREIEALSVTGATGAGGRFVLIIILRYSYCVFHILPKKLDGRLLPVTTVFLISIFYTLFNLDGLFLIFSFD